MKAGLKPGTTSEPRCSQHRRRADGYRLRRFRRLRALPARSVARQYSYIDAPPNAAVAGARDCGTAGVLAAGRRVRPWRCTAPDPPLGRAPRHRRAARWHRSQSVGDACRTRGDDHGSDHLSHRRRVRHRRGGKLRLHHQLAVHAPSDQRADRAVHHLDGGSRAPRLVHRRSAPALAALLRFRRARLAGALAPFRVERWPHLHRPQFHPRGLAPADRGGRPARQRCRDLLAYAIPAMRRAPPLIVGGGPAGCTAAHILARAGHRATLIERTTGPTDKVCGDFLSVEAIEALLACGIDLDELAPAPITSIRIIHGRRVAATRLPFAAYGLTRRVLDEALLRH